MITLLLLLLLLLLLSFLLLKAIVSASFLFNIGIKQYITNYIKAFFLIRKLWAIC